MKYCLFYSRWERVLLWAICASGVLDIFCGSVVHGTRYYLSSVDNSASGFHVVATTVMVFGVLIRSTKSTD